MITESADIFHFPSSKIYWNEIELGIASSLEVQNITKYREFTTIHGYTSKMPEGNILKIEFSIIVDSEKFSKLKKYLYTKNDCEVGKLKLMELSHVKESNKLLETNVILESEGFLHLVNASYDYNFKANIYKLNFSFTSTSQLEVIIPQFNEITEIIKNEDFIEKPKPIKKKNEKIYKRKISF